jgi:hypothetical protein
LTPAFAAGPLLVDLPVAVDLASGVLEAAVDLPAVDLETVVLAGAGAIVAFEVGAFETDEFEADDLVVVEVFAVVDFDGTVDWAFDDCKAVIAARAAMRATGSGMASRRKDPV